MTLPKIGAARTRRTFTLIELAAVLVVIGVVALIAIPTFNRFVERSEEKALVATQQAVARNVAALVAIGETPEAALAIALAESSTAFAPGVTAAGEAWVLLEQSTEHSPNAATSRSEVSWALTGGRLGWAATLGANRGVKCTMDVVTQDATCWPSTTEATGLLAATSVAGSDTPEPPTTEPEEPTTTTTVPPTTTIPAPDTPSNLSATPGVGSVKLNWTSVSGATGYVVYKGAADNFLAASEVGTPQAPPMTRSV